MNLNAINAYYSTYKICSIYVHDSILQSTTMDYQNDMKPVPNHKFHIELDSLPGCI